MARIAVGLSGGVDSSVAALLLQQAGHDVFGLFMRNWVDDSVIISDECPWVEDSHDALLVAQALGIPYQVVDLSADYKERIVEYMFAEYEAGRTPNPDVLCNREIKFDPFLQTALDLGADLVATGHYCQRDTVVVDGREVHRLLAGADPGKDQSYFLCQVRQEQLAKVVFPIGHLQKSEVRRIAARHGLVTADKRDSQGLCFVGKVRLPDFLQQRLAPRDGAIIEVPADHPVLTADSGPDVADRAQPVRYTPDMGTRVGTHHGAHFFTVGQRKGLQVGGMPEPLFVLHVDAGENILYVGQGHDHPGLNRPALFIPDADIHWVRPDRALATGEDRELQVRIRYRQPLQDARLIRRSDGLYIDFATPQRGITPGQFAAWYDGEELLGSGVIA